MDINCEKNFLSYNWCAVLYIFKLYNLFFGISIQTVKGHYNQDGEHIHHPQKLPLNLLPSPISRQPPICLLSQDMTLHFVDFCISGISTYFSVWLFPLRVIILRFILVVGLIKNSFYFYCGVIFHCMGYTTICLPVHLLMDTWVIYRFWLLPVKLLWTFLYRTLYVNMLLFLLGTYLGVEWLGHKPGVHFNF